MYHAYNAEDQNKQSRNYKVQPNPTQSKHTRLHGVIELKQEYSDKNTSTNNKE